MTENDDIDLADYVSPGPKETINLGMIVPTKRYEELLAAEATGRAAVQTAAAWDATLSEYCDGPERDALRAALATDTARAWLKNGGQG